MLGCVHAFVPNTSCWLLSLGLKAVLGFVAKGKLRERGAGRSCAEGTARPAPTAAPVRGGKGWKTGGIDVKTGWINVKTGWINGNLLSFPTWSRLSPEQPERAALGPGYGWEKRGKEIPSVSVLTLP